MVLRHGVGLNDGLDEAPVGDADLGDPAAVRRRHHPAVPSVGDELDLVST